MPDGVTDDGARQQLAGVIERFIEGLRAEMRLFPDTYAGDLAGQIIASGWTPRTDQEADHA